MPLDVNISNSLGDFIKIHLFIPLHTLMKPIFEVGGVREKLRNPAVEFRIATTLGIISFENILPKIRIATTAMSVNEFFQHRVKLIGPPL